MAVQRRAVAKEKPEDQPDAQQEEKETPKDARPTASGATASLAASAIQPRVAINIGLHSVLMLVLPLGLFFASSYGLLDPVYAKTFGIPREENKTLIGAVLAVLGVNAVIASFLISAFNEPVPPPELKED